MAVPGVLDQLKALSDEIRFGLVRHLAGRGRCVCDLEALLDLPQSKGSYHLGILREADLVAAKQRGKNIHYTKRQELILPLGGNLLGQIFTGLLAPAHQMKSIC